MVADAAAWRTWLNGNHAKSQGVRLVLAKKGATHPTTLSYDEALDEAICFGWIDGIIKRVNEEYYVARWSPRRRRSHWTESNVNRARQLYRDGRMTEAGIAALPPGTKLDGS